MQKAPSTIHRKNLNINEELFAEGEIVVNGGELNGKDYPLYIKDSLSGEIIARLNTKVIELN